MYVESNVTSSFCHGLGICTLTNPSVGDVMWSQQNFEVILGRLRHPHLDWSVCKFQAHDRNRKLRYSPHIWCSVCVRLILFSHYTLAINKSRFQPVREGKGVFPCPQTNNSRYKYTLYSYPALFNDKKVRCFRHEAACDENLTVKMCGS